MKIIMKKLPLFGSIDQMEEFLNTVPVSQKNCFIFTPSMDVFKALYKKIPLLRYFLIFTRGANEVRTKIQRNYAIFYLLSRNNSHPPQSDIGIFFRIPKWVIIKPQS